MKFIDEKNKSQQKKIHKGNLQKLYKWPGCTVFLTNIEIMHGPSSEVGLVQEAQFNTKSY